MPYTNSVSVFFDQKDIFSVEGYWNKNRIGGQFYFLIWTIVGYCVLMPDFNMLLNVICEMFPE